MQNGQQETALPETIDYPACATVEPDAWVQELNADLERRGLQGKYRYVKQTRKNIRALLTEIGSGEKPQAPVATDPVDPPRRKKKKNSIVEQGPSEASLTIEDVQKLLGR